MSKIYLKNVNTMELVKKVYELSVPQGMGFLHYTAEPLTDDEAKGLIYGNGAVNMDYVKGRACKFDIYKDTEGLYIVTPWYDHTDAQRKELLDFIGVETPEAEEHSCGCNCAECKGSSGSEVVDALMSMLMGKK